MTELGSTSASSIDWRAIPAAERLELLATIREMRDWRYGDVWPERRGPIERAALALHEWRAKNCSSTGGHSGLLL